MLKERVCTHMSHADLILGFLRHSAGKEAILSRRFI